MLKKLYRAVVPSSVRERIYGIQHPLDRWEKSLFNISRRAIRDYVESAVRGNHFQGVVIEIGSGKDNFTQTLFERHLPRVRFLRSELSAGGYGLGGEVPGNRYALFCDVTRLGFGDGRLDGVICSEVLEHVADFSAALGEIARVLKPGGTLLVTCPFLYPIHGQQDFWRFTPDALKRLLSRHFTVVDLSLAPMRRGADLFPVTILLLARRK